MSLRTIAIVLLGGLAAGTAAGQQAQEEAKRKAAMEAYAQMGMPGEEHSYLKKFAGGWTAKMTMWEASGSPPEVSEADVQGEMILGGRFASLRYAGTMMGQPFEGRQLMGFDKHLKAFRTLWIDTTSTSFFLTQGARDPSGAVVETGVWPDPMTGGTMKVRTRMSWPGPDEFVFAMFMVGPDGRENQSLELRAVRKKA